VTNSGSPRVDVVIPVFNSRRYVAETIDSVLNQDYENVHLTVIDDGSTDGSVEVVRRHLEGVGATNRVVHIVGENRGQGAVRNQGLALAEGEYFCALDADDVWEPQKLTVQVGIMESLGPETAGCLADAMVIDEHSMVRDRLSRIYPYRGGDIFEDLLLMRFVPASPTNLFRREAVAHVGGYDTGRLAEDFDLWIRLARNYRLHYVPTPLARYRIHGANQSTVSADEMFASARSVVEEFLEVDKTLAPYRRIAEARIAARASAVAYNALRLREARIEALRALSKRPSERLAWTVLARSVLGRPALRWLRSRRDDGRRLAARV
jgi:cellulose synthase/poly-beta-1,6-N-acetylglucosamine synthase-like glycosyltransferase